MPHPGTSALEFHGILPAAQANAIIIISLVMEG
jgi:hypothetical protein